MKTLRLSNVTRTFGSLVAVDRVSFELDEPGIYSLVGPNGAGKTTLFNLLKGVLAVDDGTIEFGGERVDGKSPPETTQLGISRAFQQARVFDSLSVRENVIVGFHTTREASSLSALLPSAEEDVELQQRADDLLSFVGVDADPTTSVSALPYAHQKLTSVAMTLATEPDLLLLDEPVAGMNPNERQEMLQVVRRIESEFDLTVLLIEHDMSFVTDLSDRIIVLNEGLKIADGPPEEVVHDEAVIEAYLGEGDVDV